MLCATSNSVRAGTAVAFFQALAHEELRGHGSQSIDEATRVLIQADASPT
jgi:hypothetical protein